MIHNDADRIEMADDARVIMLHGFVVDLERFLAVKRCTAAAPPLTPEAAARVRAIIANGLRRGATPAPQRAGVVRGEPLRAAARRPPEPERQARRS